MRRTHHALAIAFAVAATSAFVALAPARLAAARAQAQQAEPPRKPQGPAAGPVIKLPRGEGAPTEQTPAGVRPDAARADASPTKWEYCAVVGFVFRQKGFSISSPSVPFAVVRYFPGTVEEVEGTSEDDALANAFAKLGEDGWELAGVRTDIRVTDGTGRSSTTYFFKRPKRQE